MERSDLEQHELLEFLPSVTSNCIPSIEDAMNIRYKKSNVPLLQKLHGLVALERLLLNYL